jgi:hypothetical protein
MQVVELLAPEAFAGDRFRMTARLPKAALHGVVGVGSVAFHDGIVPPTRFLPGKRAARESKSMETFGRAGGTVTRPCHNE